MQAVKEAAPDSKLWAVAMYPSSLHRFAEF